MKTVIRRAPKSTDPAILRERLEDVELAYHLLTEAVRLLKAAPHTRARVRGTIKSAKGAVNHAERMLNQACDSDDEYDDDDCPFSDPDCTSRADECHDACERQPPVPDGKGGVL